MIEASLITNTCHILHCCNVTCKNGSWWDKTTWRTHICTPQTETWVITISYSSTSGKALHLLIIGYMGKAIIYYIFQYPLAHIDLKIFKHSFPAHCNYNSVVLHLNIKNRVDMYSANNGHVHTGSKSGKKNRAETFLHIPSRNNSLQ